MSGLNREVDCGRRHGEPDGNLGSRFEAIGAFRIALLSFKPPHESD
jgi:hypothetical protein